MAEPRRMTDREQVELQDAHDRMRRALSHIRTRSQLAAAVAREHQQHVEASRWQFVFEAAHRALFPNGYEGLNKEAEA